MLDDELRNYVLLDIEDLLTKSGSSIREKNLPLPRTAAATVSTNRLIHEETCYNLTELADQHLRMLGSLNPEQRHIYNEIKRSVDMNESRQFFVNGHGGTGKTFLWNTLIAGIRCTGKIVLAIAFSGIASLLLPGGRTAHSRFKIPLSIDKWSTCEIKKGSHLAALLLKTSLIVWDEAPMIHKFCFEALDKSMRDVMSSSSRERECQPFGGVTVVLGGDFRQILPVIPGRTKTDILQASICTSILWRDFTIFTLVTNMRLLQPGMDDRCRRELGEFARWLLEVGDGKVVALPSPADEEGSWICVPHKLLVPYSGNAFVDIFSAIYEEFESNFAEPFYLNERAIVTPYNETAAELNSYVLEKIPADYVTLLSCDTIPSSSDASNHQDVLPS